MARRLAASLTMGTTKGMKREEPSVSWPPEARLDRPEDSLLELLEAAAAAPGHARPARSPLEGFLQEKDAFRCLRIWPGPAVLARMTSKRELLEHLDRAIARIDTVVSAQVNSILHDPAFQRLEASWRGLRYLAEEADRLEPSEGEPKVKIRVLNASREELVEDAEEAVDFDQSELFRKVYTGAFDMPGAEPFGVILGDYEFTAHPQDVDFLAKISGVAAAAFSPFVGGMAPAFLGVKGFAQLEPILDAQALLEHPQYRYWHEFRKSEDSRFVGLTLPRILVRLPHEEDGSRGEIFRFREDVEGPDSSKYLWGSGAWALGAVLIRAFHESGWFGDVRGVRRDEKACGLVPDLPSPCHSTDKPGLISKGSTDIFLTEDQERQMEDMGFICLSQCKDSEYCAFYGMPSVQKPKAYDERAATQNAKISSMLHYMLCVARFAHYLKTIILRKIGSFAEAPQLETHLNNWLSSYVAPDVNAPLTVKARFPLRDSRVEVREGSRKGQYECLLYLQPHYQFDAVEVKLTLAADLTRGQGARGGGR